MSRNSWWCGAHIALAGLLAFVLAAPAQAFEQITYYHNDVIGSPIAATDASGTVVWKEGYAPYGQRLKLQDGGSNNIGFHGKPSDAETGLSYFGARYYDAVIGRFMGMDPKGFDENNLHSFNRYAYGNDNPYRFLDPDGATAIDERELPIAGVGPSSRFEMERARNIYNDLRNNRPPLTGREGSTARFGPTNPGPLPDTIANTFRGGSYTQTNLSRPLTLYRVHGGRSPELGQFWTTDPPSGPLQARIDLAIKPEWGNTATKVTTINVPAGQTIFEGPAAAQGNLVGGGNQVYIPRVDPAWVVQ